MTQEYYTIAEAARMLGIHYQTVRNYLLQGKLYGIEVGRAIQIPKSEFDRLARKKPNRLHTKEQFIELRFRVSEVELVGLNRTLVELNAQLTGFSRVEERYFVPCSIKSKEKYLQWYSTQQGHLLTVRQSNIDDFLMKKVTFEAHKQNGTFVSQVVQNKEQTRKMLELMNYKCVLTLNKNETSYNFRGVQCQLETIASQGGLVTLKITNKELDNLAMEKLSNIADLIHLMQPMIQEESYKNVIVLEMAMF